MNRVLFDLAALISRVTIGVIFVAHGWQKWQNGIDATSTMFTQAGVPLPELAAGFTTVAETVGGAFLIIGLLTRVAALCLLVVSVGAIAYVHSWNGIFVANNGWELVGALAAACLLFVVLGAGRISVDGIFRSMFGKRAERKVADQEAQARVAPVAAVAPVATEQQRVAAEEARAAEQQSLADKAAEQERARAAQAAAEQEKARAAQAAADERARAAQAEHPSDAAVMDDAVKSAVEEKRAASTQQWTEQDLQDIDDLFADNKKPPTG